jgi:hypothetical protein
MLRSRSLRGVQILVRSVIVLIFLAHAGCNESYNQLTRSVGPARDTAFSRQSWTLMSIAPGSLGESRSCENIATFPRPHRGMTTEHILVICSNRVLRQCDILSRARCWQGQTVRDYSWDLAQLYFISSFTLERFERREESPSQAGSRGFELVRRLGTTQKS